MDTTQVTSSEAANIESAGEQNTSDSTAVAQSGQQAATVTATSDPDMYDVKVNGRTFKVPLDELRNGYQRNQDYTQKSMALADERRGWTDRETQYQEQLQKVQTFLADPRVQNALRQLQAGVTDPSQPLTVQQAQQLYESQAAQQNEMTQKKMEEMANEIEVRTMTAQFTNEIGNTLRQVLDKHSVLKSIDGIDQLLRNDVLQRNPANIDEAKRLFIEIADARAERINSLFQQHQNAAAVQAAQLKRNGIEPPGGAQQGLPQPTTHKLGSTELFKAALEDYGKQSAKA